MKSILRILINLFALFGIAAAEPVGIYLYAIDGKAAAGDKVICLEFDRVLMEGANYRFYDSGGRSYLISNFKFRTMIYYDDAVGVENPNFKVRLKLYEETLNAYPASRRFLEHRALKMRNESEGLVAQMEARAKLQKLTVGDQVFLGPKFSGFQGGKLYIKHADGGSLLDLDKFSDRSLEELKKIDPSAAGIITLTIGGARLWNPKVQGLSGGCVVIANAGDPLKLDLDKISALDLKKVFEMNPSLVLKPVTIAGVKLWNPSFAGIVNSDVMIRHEKGTTKLKRDSLADGDRRTIMSWSDNTWTLNKPGLYKPAADGLSYGEIVFSDGRMDSGVSLSARRNEEILVKTNRKTAPFSIKVIYEMDGLTSQDKDRLKGWIGEMIEARVEKAKPELRRDILAFDPTTDEGAISQASGRIQSLENTGVLVSGLSGKRLRGKQTVRTTSSVTVKHPVTDEAISKITGSSESQQDVIQEISEELCFITTQAKKAKVNQLIKLERIRPSGSYTYTPDFQASKKISSYSVN